MEDNTGLLGYCAPTAAAEHCVFVCANIGRGCGGVKVRVKGQKRE